MLTVGSPAVPISLGQTLAGTLSISDQPSQDRLGKHADFYALTLTASTQVTIDLKQEDLDFNNGFKFFRLSVTVGTAASLVDATVLGLDPRYGFATDNDAATVVQND